MASGFYARFPSNHDELVAGLTRFFRWGPEDAAGLDAAGLIQWCERAAKIAEQERG